jgi:exopolyphosphatase/guanosine-5'-triphosphate,3'-diphosphate pyrophosphatase
MLERKLLFTKNNLLLLSLLFILGSCSTFSTKQCVINRAAFDIGSGSTKMTIAKVDTCQNKIVEILFEDQSSVSYKQSLYDNDNSFSKEVISKGVAELKELKATAVDLGVVEFSALATEAFRTAKNGEETISKLEDETDIEIRVINQELEAKFGYLGAKIKNNFKDEDNVLVWDIGGGSMQMAYVENGEYKTYLGKIASVSFKETVLEKYFSASRNSPNPLGKSKAKKSLSLARFFAHGNVPKEVKEYIKKARVFGVGGVHYYSIRKQALKKGHIYNQPQLRMALRKRSKLSDRKIGGKYASTDVTNIALVLGFMEALGIRKVETLKVNMSHGLFLDKASW